MAVAARLYARSLFEAAKEEKRLEPVLEELGDFVAALEEVPELRSLLTNPQLDPDERTAALDEILGGADELIRNFLRLLSEKGRTAQIDEIYREFEELVAAEQKRLTVELTTAYELSDDEAADHPEEDREVLRPLGRGDPQGRSRPDRRDHPPGRLAPARRERPRPHRPTTP